MKNKFMQRAIELSIESINSGGGPFGSVIAKGDKIISEGMNGEPPLMLGMSVFFAIKDAIASVGNYKIMPNLNAPATPEAILLSINDIKKKL